MSMSTMKKVCLAGLAIVASANAEPQTVSDCEIQLSTVMNNVAISSPRERCEALVTYSKCLSQFPANKGGEELLFKQNSKACEVYWKKLDTPTLQVRNDDLSITVDDAKDVKFYRHRREEISVFDLNEQVGKLMGHVKDLQDANVEGDKQVGTLMEQVEQLQEANAALTKAAQDQEDAVTKSLADTTNLLKDQLEKTSEELEDAFDEKSQAIDQTVAGLESKVDNSVSATNKQLDEAKKEAKANMDALEKKIGQSVDSKLKPGAKVIASLANTYHSNPKIPVFRVGKWHTYNNRYGWLDGNRPNGYGGVHPSQWTNDNFRADQMTNDFKALQRLFTRKATANEWGATICSEVYGQRSSTTGGVCGAIFRIKNTGKSTVTWKPALTMTSFHGWAESASISINGNNLIGAKDCRHECRFTQNVAIPANSAGNRISTVVFISTSSEDHGHYNQWRSTVLMFGDNALKLPSGLEFIDDLDVQTGAWKK